MNLLRQTSNHYYGWSGIPNQWINDNDRSYHDKFFDNKNYEDFYFDNFYDMDEMFGHENSLFGTRGLPVGHPNRSSKSFDTYNKKFGPMIVRVIKNNDLQENIRKVLREETEVIPTFMLRRINEYVNNVLLAYGYHNLQGNFKNLIDEISDVIINDLLSDYIDSIGYTVDDEDDNYDQSVVDKVYDKYYNLLAEHIQGNYSDEIYKLYRKNKK